MRTSLAVPFLSLLAACKGDYGFNPSTEDDGTPEDTGVTVVDTDDTDPAALSVVEEFTVGEKVDIIVFGDTSGSMEEELITMGANITQFVDRLALGRSDWHLAAVTGPNGCNQGGIITPDTPDFAAKFAAGIVTKPGYETEDEWGLNNVAVAVEQSVAGGCNEGLVREGALLHIIFISDEDDNSPGYIGDPSYWMEYVDRVHTAKGDAAAVKFSAVIGDVPYGCTSPTNTAEPGTGYWEAVAASEGQFVSICSDWAPQLDLIADLTNVQDIFPLTYVPIDGTLEVEVDGETRASSDWVYVPTARSLKFTFNPPIAGAQVVIRYEFEGN